MAKITDPAALAAAQFVREYYAELGELAPAQFSPEERHALAVLAAYVRQRGEPVAWRWRYVHEHGAGHWHVRQEAMESQPAPGPNMAALEVQPLYAESIK